VGTCSSLAAKNITSRYVASKAPHRINEVGAFGQGDSQKREIAMPGRNDDELPTHSNT